MLFMEPFAYPQDPTRLTPRTAPTEFQPHGPHLNNFFGLSYNVDWIEVDKSVVQEVEVLFREDDGCKVTTEDAPEELSALPLLLAVVTPESYAPGIISTPSTTWRFNM